MRPLALGVGLCLGALLATAAWAQSTALPGGTSPTPNSPAAATSGNTASPGNAGSSSSSSRAEPVAKAANDEPQQEKPPAPVPALTPVPQGPSPEAGQQYIELKYNVDGTDLQGNKLRSFLHEGINHTSELSYFVDGPLLEIRKFEFLAVGRYTNNPQVDPERNSLQRFYLRLTGPTFYANVGDDLVNYSRLTFNQNVKGLNFWKNLTPNWKWTGTVGLFSDRWGSLYRDFTAFRNITLDCQAASTPGNPAPGCVEISPGRFALSPATPTKPYTRLVGGARLERKIGRNSWLAANWSHGSDLTQSLPEATITCVDSMGNLTVEPTSSGCPAGQSVVPDSQLPGLEAIDNDTVSADTRVAWEPWHLEADGEFAYSWTVGGTPPPGAATNPMSFACAPVAPIVGADVLDARCFSSRVGDYAGRFEAFQRIKKLSWRVDYARFQPNFFSANARQIRDLQDFTARSDFSFNRQVTLTGSWRRSNDNLNGEKDFTSLVHAPEIQLAFQDLPFYRRMTIQVGYRERNIKAVGHPVLTELQNTSTRIPYISVTLPVGRTRFGLDYEHRHAEDAVTPALATDTDHYGVGIRGDYSFNMWDFSPSFRVEFERLNKSLPNNPTLSPSSPGIFFPEDFFGAFDTNRTYNAGFFLEAPRYFRFEGEYREFNSVILSPLQPLSTTGFFYLNQGFKRPSWRASVTYKIGNDENRRITLFYVRTNNFFATGFPGVPDLKSFRETVIGATVILRFRP